MDQQTTLCGRPLTFGDREQIKVINSMQRESELEEQRKEEGHRFRVEVDVVFRTREWVEVVALDDADALEVAADVAAKEHWEADDIEPFSARKI